MIDTAKTSSYDYCLPKELIASYPASPPDSARLLVYERKTCSIIHATFKDLFSFIPQKTAFILNDTKVIKARVYGHKKSGGRVEVLLNNPISHDSFKAYIRGRVKAGTIIVLENEIFLHVKELLNDGMRIVNFTCKDKLFSVDEVYEVLERIGHVPLPPYIKREDTKEDGSAYQSLFAKNMGAVAAPTASLHFTKKMLKDLYGRYEHAFITLHVGAGTFKPIESEDIDKHIMHEEYFSLSKEAKELIDSDTKLLALGTTATRTIEYYVRDGRSSGWCNLFLHPKNPPKRVEYLLTNFHLPRSTLLMLVASFIGLDMTIKIYKEAVRERYRFFSYGDAMLII